MAVFLIWIIGLYRRFLSPALPPACRFEPSCSSFALEAISEHGVWRGTGLAVCRILRCHPWHAGGWDPVPGRKGGVGERSDGSKDTPRVRHDGGRAVAL